MPTTAELLSDPKLQKEYNRIAPLFVEGVRKLVRHEQLHRASIGKSTDHQSACLEIDGDMQKVMNDLNRSLKIMNDT